MPELPEVETYVRELEPLLAGRQVLAAQVLWPRTVASPSPEEFVARIAGQRFQSFGRRAKYMLLGLQNGDTLIVHLRMTGHLYVRDGAEAPDAHTHVLFDLDDGRRLHYQDPRKFGRMWLTAEPQHVLRKLGPEPLGEQFDVAALESKLAGRKASIKALLLDQSLAAGVGNIYADEALFRAAIHPARPGGSLTAEEIARLRTAVAAVLAEGIAAAGSSLGTSGLQNYSRPGGQSGGFQDEHRVFRRTGKPCLTCGAPIERVVLGQRSTHFCPHCQCL
jgi:formamidopyrimidine-DNA glycosylase